MKELAAASIVILAGITGAYLYVYSLYRRRLFLYIACAWAVNLIYILIEAGTLAADHSFHVPRTIVASAATLFSTAFFTLALFDVLPLPSRRRWEVTWGLVMVVVTPAALAFRPPAPLANYRTEVGIVGIALVTAACLATLAVCFLRMPESRLLSILRNESLDAAIRRDASHNNEMWAPVSGSTNSRPPSTSVRRVLNTAKAIFAITFLIYAALQPFYPLKPLIDAVYPTAFGMLFWISLVAKGVHGVAIPLLVLGDLRDTSDALRDRSVAEEIGVLTASIEHDIKSPLALIYKEIDVIKSKYQHVPGLTDRLNGLTPHADRIRSAASVIAATREAVEHFHRFAEVFNAISIVRAAAVAVKKVDKMGDIRLPISHSRSEIMIYCERASLTQALVNLMNNGIEACRARTDGKPPLLEIDCSVDRVRYCCDISIKDYGIGIASDRIGSVGRAFYSTKKSGHGQNRGIGVFMASRVIRLHGGQLRYMSDGQNFTTALVTLPLADGRKGSKA